MSSKPSRIRRIRPTAPRLPSRSEALQALGNRVVRLSQMPDPLPPDCLFGWLGIDPSSRRPVVLCHVDKLNKLPKSLPVMVQSVADFWVPSCEQPILVHTSGKIYLVING